MAATHEQDSTGPSTLPGGLVPAAIFCLAFGFRFAFLLQMRHTPMRDYAELPWQQWFIQDSAYYHQLGSSIAQGDLIAPTAHFLSPLYCYFVGLVYAIFGVDLDAVRLAQCVLGSFSCVLLYWIGRRTFSEFVGIASGLCLAMYGLHIYYTEIILPTVLVVFLNLAFLCLISIAPAKLTPARVAGAGVIVGLAALAKANALLLAVVTVAVLWWQHRKAGHWQSVRLTIPLVVAMFLTIAPVTVHNYVASGEFVLITTTGGRNLLKGNGPTANGTHVQLPPALAGGRLEFYLDGDVQPKGAARQSREMVTLTRKFMASQPIASVKLLVKKSLLFLNQRELFIRDNFYFAKRHSGVLSLPLPGFALVGVLGLAGALWGLRRWESAAHVYAMLLVQIASYTLVFVLARYRLVAVACLISLRLQLPQRYRSDRREAQAPSTRARRGRRAVLCTTRQYSLRRVPVRAGLPDYVGANRANPARIAQQQDPMERPTPFAAAAFHECQANRGLPSGTAEPHGFRCGPKIGSQ